MQISGNKHPYPSIVDFSEFLMVQTQYHLEEQEDVLVLSLLLSWFVIGDKAPSYQYFGSIDELIQHTMGTKVIKNHQTR